MQKGIYGWQHVNTIPSRRFNCGYCGAHIASQLGYIAPTSMSNSIAYIYICHECTQPTFIDPGGFQAPGSMYGDSVLDISDQSVADLYEEARRAIGAGSFTAAILCCRKLLMHIAVAKGASEGGTFVSYVQYLADNHYVPPDAVSWVDHIRAKGNEANHQIVIMSRSDAEELVSFCEMLLKVIYQFPAAVKKKTAGTPAT